MDRARVDGIEFEYELSGSGDPVVLIHAGVCADFFRPLDLTGAHTVLRYHRCGYAGSDRPPGAVSLADHAADCHRLMRALGIESAHVVGHSSSACIALQLALDAPEAVRSLVLADPARPACRRRSTSRWSGRSRSRRLSARLARLGGRRRRLDAWRLRPRIPRAARARTSGPIEQAVADADTFFGQELPAVMQWSFGPAEALRVTQPALALVGEHSIEVFRERRDLLLEWLPLAEPFELEGATHLLQVENPSGMADALLAFFARLMRT